MIFRANPFFLTVPLWEATRRRPVDKYQIRLAYRTWFSSPDEYRLVSYELEPLSVHIFGNVANVYYIYTWGTKKESKHSHGRVMQTYLKQDNEWMLIGSMGALYYASTVQIKKP